MTGLNAYNPMRQTAGAARVMQPGRLNGDYGSGFAGTFTSELDRHAAPVGAAANQASLHGRPRTIDRTSELYEKSMEMESYIVRQMLSSMRSTVLRADGEQGYAARMYEDMLYDEYAVQMTKSAGFGLADQLYLQLSADGTGGVDITA